MRVEWDLGPCDMISPSAEVFKVSVDEDNESEEGDFNTFLGGYLAELEPQYGTKLEELLEQLNTSASSKEMKNTVAEVALAVTTLEVETQANMCVCLFISMGIAMRLNYMHNPTFLVMLCHKRLKRTLCVEWSLPIRNSKLPK